MNIMDIHFRFRKKKRLKSSRFFVQFDETPIFRRRVVGHHAPNFRVDTIVQKTYRKIVQFSEIDFLLKW